MLLGCCYLFVESDLGTLSLPIFRWLFVSITAKKFDRAVTVNYSCSQFVSLAFLRWFCVISCHDWPCQKKTTLIDSLLWASEHEGLGAPLPRFWREVWTLDYNTAQMGRAQVSSYNTAYAQRGRTQPTLQRTPCFFYFSFTFVIFWKIQNTYIQKKFT